MTIRILFLDGTWQECNCRAQKVHIKKKKIYSANMFSWRILTEHFVLLHQELQLPHLIKRRQWVHTGAIPFSFWIKEKGQVKNFALNQVISAHAHNAHVATDKKGCKKFVSVINQPLVHARTSQYWGFCNACADMI